MTGFRQPVTEVDVFTAERNQKDPRQAPDEELQELAQQLIVPVQARLVGMMQTLHELLEPFLETLTLGRIGIVATLAGSVHHVYRRDLNAFAEPFLAVVAPNGPEPSRNQENLNQKKCDSASPPAGTR